MKIKTEDLHGSPNRYCKPCGRDHGPLYVCHKWPAEQQAKVRAEGVRWIEKLQDPEWIKEQLASGVSEEAIMINKIFAGVK